METNQTISKDFRRTSLSPEAIVEKLSRLPVLRDAEAREAASRHDGRMKLGDELERISKERERQLLLLEAAVHTAAKRLADILPRYNAAIASLQEANQDYSSAYADFDAKITRCEAVLRQTSHPVIEEALAELRELHAANIRRRPETFEVSRENYADGHAKRVTFKSDKASLEKRSAAILEAQRAAEAMKLDADQSDIEARLGALIESLPEIATIEFTQTYDRPNEEKRRYI
jgi:hypothetical protein